jgi:2-(1,2-epoxy-1,2-dihydrophenyl)acetyl-CoA isomerase
MSATVSIDRDGAVPVVRLERPHRLNAINVELLEDLTTALRAVADERVVVLEGAGRAFCVGEDLKETLAPRTGSAAELRHAFGLLQEVTRLLTGAPAVFVAAVQGFAVGGGAELALAADLVVGERDLRMRFPEVTLGHAVTGGISVRLPAMVGLLRAKELLLSGRWIEAEEALGLGLLNRIEVDARAAAREWAAELAQSPARSMAATKRGLELAAVAQQETVLAAEVDAASWCFAASEAQESIDDFRSRHA